ncbi:MAG: hypothetical protein WC895_04335, partial [Candidatus Shapirobacteria bacterium]
RNRIAAQLAYQLLFLPSNSYLEIEKQGDDIRFFNGKSLFYIECKKNAPGKANSWTVSNLKKEGILEFFANKYINQKTNTDNNVTKDFRAILISSDHSSRLDILADKGKRNCLDSEDMSAIRKEFSVPDSIIDLSDFFSHLEIASVSKFAMDFLLGPIYQKSVDLRVLSLIQGHIFVHGFFDEKIDKKLLAEKIPDVKTWIDRNNPIPEPEVRLDKVNFFRQSINISDVKIRLEELEELYVSDHGKFNEKVMVGLNYYNINIKYILGILDIYKTRSYITNEDADFLAINIKDNPIYLWHFLKGLVGSKWLKFYKNSLYKDIFDKSDSGIKGLLVEYLKTTIKDFPSESLDCLFYLVKNNSDERVCRSICEALVNIDKEDERIWKILKIIANHNDSWVREEVAKTIETICKYNYRNSLFILKQLLTKKVDPKDVVTGGPILSLKFQGRDLENHAFNQAMTTLGKLLNEYPGKSYEFAIELMLSYLKKENRIKSRNSKTLSEDLSHFWYSQSNPENREHEYDKKERLAMEIEASFQEHIKLEYKDVEKLSRVILGGNSEIFYIIVLRVLVKITGLFELKKEIIFNTEIWKIHGIREGYLQSLIKQFFVDNPNLVPEYKYKVSKETFEPRIRDLIIKELINPLDRDKKTFPMPVGVVFTEVNEKSGPNLNSYSEDDVFKIVTRDKTAKIQVDKWKLRGSLNSLGETKPNLGLKLLIKLVKSNDIESEIVGELIDGLIKGFGKKIEQVNSIINYIRDKDEWGKLSLARYFQEKCRSANKISIKNRKLIIKSLDILSSDIDPIDNENSIESDHALNLVTDGINSVRGVVAETVCYYLHFFPNNKKAGAIFTKLSSDNSYAVRATILYNLKYLVQHPTLYEQSKEILNQYKNIRIAGVDIAIIEYLSHLGGKKFEENKEWISIISKHSTNDEVLDRLGQVVSSRYLGGFSVKEYMDREIVKKEGDARIRLGMAYQLESNYAQVVEGKLSVPKTDVLVYLKHLINPAVEHDLEVRNRAAFVFNREEVLCSELVDFINNDLFVLIGNDVFNAHSQESAVKFLVRCSCNDITNTVKAICQMINKDSMILNDSLGVRDIMVIVKEGLSNKDKLNQEFTIKLENILDLMIEKGWDEAVSYFKTLIN